MTLDQIDHVLRELGWSGKPGSGPEVCMNGHLMGGRMWIERDLVVFETDDLGCGIGGSKSWMEPGKVTHIAPALWAEKPARRLKLVE